MNLNTTESLLEIIKKINSTLDISHVLDFAMESAEKIMNAEASSIFEIDEEKGELFFRLARGEKCKKVKEIRLNLGEGIAGWVALHNQPVIIKDAKKDERFSKRADTKSKFVTESIICVPLKIKEKTIGVLQVLNRKDGVSFTGDDLSLLTHLAEIIAIALENARLYREIKETFFETAYALAEAIEKRDPYTGGHTKRVTDFCMAMADYLSINSEDREVLKLSAILHDIGKIGIEDRILRKNGPLDDVEFSQIKQHPAMGADIMEYIKRLEKVIPGMLYHHERMDGQGYPTGLTGDRMPFLARIIAVADAFDAMTSDRPYRAALADEIALEELSKNAGKQFDQEVVNAFLSAYENDCIHSFGSMKKQNHAAT